MKLLSILSLVGCATFLILAITLALTRGSLNLHVRYYFFVVRPLYLLAVAAVALVIGWLALANPVP